MEISRTGYSGPSRKLVVALDIGTTFSGAAYVLLDPGEVPEVRSVKKQVFLLIIDQVTNCDDERQVPRQSESRVGKSLFHNVLRSQRRLLWD